MSMTRVSSGTSIVIVVAASLMALLASPAARAQEAPEPFGGRHQVVVSAERLAVFVHANQPGYRTDTVALLGNVSAVQAFAAMPRLAADFMVLHRLSIGVAASYFSTTYTGLPFGPAHSIRSWGYVLAPRLGGVFTLWRTLSVWPRVGLSYGKSMADPLWGRFSLSGATIEAPFELALTPHALVAVGPIVEIGLGSSGNVVTHDPSLAAFGIQFSVGGFF